MNSKALITGFLVITFTFSAFGQKIKYKDLFVLLNAKAPEGELYLKKYLQKEDENPNAYLFMGFIYQEKAAKFDVLKQTTEAIVNFDSAVYFYGKSSKIMTEREVNKNKEYYQMYSRRDMRSGEFGVKYSDVLLDIETRVKDIKERTAKIKELKLNFEAMQKAYEHAQQEFLVIQKMYPGQRELNLRADEKLHTDLNQLALVYDSCHNSFNDYKALLQDLGKTGYNQDLDPLEIVDFKKDGVTPADFYRDAIKVWDYKRWALGNVEAIDEVIKPIKEQLVALDVEINAAQQKLKKDSVVVITSVKDIRKKMEFTALRKIDENPLPIQLFEMKVAELDYGNQIVSDRPLRDSTNMFLRLTAVKKELNLIRRMDSLSVNLMNRNLLGDIENYHHFVTTAYGSADVMNSLIKSTHDFAAGEAARKEHEVKTMTASLRWIVSAADSVPLFMDVVPKSRFKPLLLLPEKFTAGLQFKDSLSSGYFYTISSSRKPDVSVMFPVDQKIFTKRNLPFTKALVAHDDGQLVFFILFYSEVKVNNKYPASIVKLYRKEGLSWSANFGFDQIPTELVFSLETFELTVTTKSSIGEIFPVLFDKGGKLIK